MPLLEKKQTEMIEETLPIILTFPSMTHLVWIVHQTEDGTIQSCLMNREEKYSSTTLIKKENIVDVVNDFKRMGWVPAHIPDIQIKSDTGEIIDTISPFKHLHSEK